MWIDPTGRHRVACLDAANSEDILNFVGPKNARLAIQDPPYNFVAFDKRSVNEFIDWCRKWVAVTIDCLKDNSALYIWLGADQKHHFQPLPQFMLMMSEIKGLQSRSLITMRNQRGYGTQHNWMAVRQELLYYTKGTPPFAVQYTDIPKVLRGYYKEVGGSIKENIERGKSETIRPGNVWIDVQQVFYRMQENSSGCYAQKPLKAVDRIVCASSREDELVIDFFSHSGTTLLSCERLNRRCYVADIDPIYCELTIRRLEHYRRTGKEGWQNGHAFEDVLDAHAEGKQTDRQKSLFP